MSDLRTVLWMFVYFGAALFWCHSAYLFSEYRDLLLGTCFATFYMASTFVHDAINQSRAQRGLPESKIWDYILNGGVLFIIFIYIAVTTG